MGAWIETVLAYECCNVVPSLPMWERGLKLTAAVNIYCIEQVAPHVGAWIETQNEAESGNVRFVAPHVGAWIETKINESTKETDVVAPHVGAWIETPCASLNSTSAVGRSPCGSVD